MSRRPAVRASECPLPSVCDVSRVRKRGSGGPKERDKEGLYPEIERGLI